MGNYRVIQKIDFHNVMYVSNPSLAQDPGARSLMDDAGPVFGPQNYEGPRQQVKYHSNGLVMQITTFHPGTGQK